MKWFWSKSKLGLGWWLFQSYSQTSIHACLNSLFIWRVGEMAQGVKWLLCKCEDLSLNPQDPCKAGHHSVYLLSCAYMTIRWEMATGEMQDICRSARLLCAAPNNRPCLSNKKEEKDWYLRLSCVLLMSILTYALLNPHTNTHPTQKFVKLFKNDT